MADDKPIIIIKKKGGHGGHHGGAWKVAYADFVTAMMAFFMVMWLVNTADQQTKQNIASYFRRPGLFESGSGTPLLIGEAGILPDAYVPSKPQDSKKTGGKDQDIKLPQKTGTDNLKDKKKQVTIKGEAGKSGGLKDAKGQAGLQKDDAKTQGALVDPKLAAQAAKEAEAAANEKQLFDKIAEELKAQIAASKELQGLLGVVDVKVDADGLNIEIMDTEKNVDVCLGERARVLPDAQKAFEKIGGIIKKLPYSVDIVGHTDSKPFSSRAGGYSNWELSSDRANSARRLLESEGMEPTRIASVVGRADKNLRLADNPNAAANRRITLKMRFKFNKTLDLAKNPNALEHVDEQPPPPDASQSSVDNPAESVHQVPVKPVKTVAANDHYIPKNAVKAAQRDDLIQLPDTDENGAPTAGEKTDKMFGDAPIVAPTDPFSNF